MDDERMEAEQQRWLAAARRRQGPSAATGRRMREGLRARIEAGEGAPVWKEAAVGEVATVERRERSVELASSRWRPWLVGAGVLLAAAALVLWLGRGDRRELARASDPNAAELDAAPRPGARAMERASGGAAERSNGAAAPSAEPSVEPELRAPSSGTERARDDVEEAAGSVEPKRALAGEARRSTNDRPPSTAAPEPEPANEATPTPGLDVAGEAAVLRRAKSAIERAAWREASEALDAYDREHPSGVLAPEAEALRVLVACGRGATDASARAQEYLRRHVSSPLRERIGRACSIDPIP